MFSESLSHPILAKVFKLLNLILVAPQTNTISERSFSALKRFKKWDLLDQTIGCFIWWPCMTFQEEIDKIDIRKTADQFATMKGSRKEKLSFLLVLQD